MDLELDKEGSGERRDHIFFVGSLFYCWEVELRPKIWSIIVIEYLIMIISNKFVRNSLQLHCQSHSTKVRRLSWY